jgi:hypothetical protein
LLRRRLCTHARDCYPVCLQVRFWSFTANLFQNNSNIIAYELINEPWAGDVYAVCVVAVARTRPHPLPLLLCEASPVRARRLHCTGVDMNLPMPPQDPLRFLPAVAGKENLMPLCVRARSVGRS